MKKQRFTAALLAGILALTLVSVPLMQPPQEVYAADPKGQGNEVVENDATGGGTTASGYKYKVNGTNASITGYIGTEKKLDVPTKITVGETSGSGAAGSSGSSTAASGSSATSTSTSAVSYNVTTIEKDAFKGMLGIDSVKLSGGIDKDGNQFGITSIGDGAFAGCHLLTKVELPATLDSLGKRVFSDCMALASISVESGNNKYISLEDALYSYSMSGGTGSYTLVQYPLGKTDVAYTVPASIATRLTAIGDEAFEGCTTLTTITIPVTVKSIGEQAFANCTALTDIEIPASVTSLGAGAFMGCTALTTAKVGDSITAINEDTFNGCTALKTVELPLKLTSIGARAFYGCKSLQEIAIPGNVTTIGDYAFADCSSLYRVTIPVKTTNFGTNVFSGTVATIYCHDGSRAAYYAANNRLAVQRTYTVNFYSNATMSNLLSSQEVVEGGDAVPPTVNGADGYTILWSGSYTNVQQDLSLYSDIRKLYTVTFEDTYHNREQAVQVAEGLTPTVPNWTKDNYTLSWDVDVTLPVTGDYTANAIWTKNSTGYQITKDTVKPKKKGTELEKDGNSYVVTESGASNPEVKLTGINADSSLVKVPSTIKVDGVTYKVASIASRAAYKNKKLQTVEIGENVRKINGKAFYGCTKLKTVRILSKSVKSIGSQAFGKTNAKAKFYAYFSKLTSYKSMLKSSGYKNPKMVQL